MRNFPDYDLSTATWHKSSYSGGSGGECLEIARWRKSTYSGGGGNDCLEVADAHPTLVPVRDSKTPTARSSRSGRRPGRRSSRASRTPQPSNWQMRPSNRPQTRR